MSRHRDDRDAAATEPRCHPANRKSPSCSGGATKQDIAQTLCLSPRTVEKHVARVLTKLRTGQNDIQGSLPNSDRPGSDEPA
ncbi:LuxR C-terminal-related transcriptional regulator [Streptomyces neyagawaensis]|uniref:LuxR C-terminal-related transcriptional regulator n=1 Tax=Streptomyces neyagawaensis TaxID=42238 RepID=A0ABV3ATU2_9ACTN